jgi:hypothetical protein
MRILTDELQQIYMILGAPPTGPAPDIEPELPPSDGDDDVIDAEFTPSE